MVSTKLRALISIAECWNEYFLSHARHFRGEHHGDPRPVGRPSEDDPYGDPRDGGDFGRGPRVRRALHRRRQGDAPGAVPAGRTAEELDGESGAGAVEGARGP